MRCVSFLGAMPILPRHMISLLDVIVSARALWGGPRVPSDSALVHMHMMLVPVSMSSRGLYPCVLLISLYDGIYAVSKRCKRRGEKVPFSPP